jgi:hypothetical protein
MRRAPYSLIIVLHQMTDSLMAGPINHRGGLDPETEHSNAAH